LPLFICPKCHSKLNQQGKVYICDGCKVSWPVVHNIPRFAQSESKWSVFKDDIADKITELAEQKTWQEAVDTYAHTLGAYTLNYITEESRADFHVILPIHSGATVLDIGSGWGNIALELARWCKKVYCCDLSMTNLRLLQARMRDRGVKNVAVFQHEANDFMRLPFPDASIDVAVLNGVLEWMGVAEIDAPPSRIQLEALKEIRRVLKLGGALYIGIENRYSARALRGQRIHGELPFVGLLPRWLSNLITKLVRGEEHRTYIYSLSGYRKLIRRAGFETIDFYLPYPSYHHPNYLIALQSAWIKWFWFDQLSVSRSIKYSLFKRLRLSRLPFHWLAYSFSIRCVK